MTLTAYHAGPPWDEFSGRQLAVFAVAAIVVCMVVRVSLW